MHALIFGGVSTGAMGQTANQVTQLAATEVAARGACHGDIRAPERGGLRTRGDRRRVVLSSLRLVDLRATVIDACPHGAALVRRVLSERSAFGLAGVVHPQVYESSIGPDARTLGAASLPLFTRFAVERTPFLKGPDK